MSKLLLAVFVLLITMQISIAATTSEAVDPNLRISIGSESFNGKTYPTVTLENSVQKAVIRTQYGGKNTGGVESVIKDWTLKSVGRDLVKNFVDANSFRGPLSRAVVTNNGADSKTVRLNYVLGSIVEYTIIGYSPVLKVKYEKYDVIPTSNIVDRPGSGGSTRVYGQGGWIRSITGSYYPCAYWDTYETSLGGCGISYGPDPSNAGSLNYKGNIIMAYGGADSNGAGIGRVMPIYTGTNGGIKILKIFSDGGFEPYQATARGQLTRPPHVGYIYLFKSGVDNAITQGKQIVDGGAIVPPPPGGDVSLTVISPNGGENWLRGTTKSIKWSSVGIPSTENVDIKIFKGSVQEAHWIKPNTGTWSFTLTPTTYPTGTGYTVRITGTGSNSGVTDVSNGSFTMS